MNRTAVTALAACLATFAAFAVPAEAGHHGHSKGSVPFYKVGGHSYHAWRGYRRVYAEPVCLKKAWVWYHGHKKLICVLWE